MRKIFFRFLLLAAVVSVVSLSFSCNWLTETGNPGEIVDPRDPVNTPEEPSMEPGSQDPAGNYLNREFGVKIAYDDGVWSLSERTSSTAKFLSETDLKTSVFFEFSKIEEGGSSLLSRLQEQYPDRVFAPYDAKHVSGFRCEMPGDADSESQLLNYYFMSEDVLISAEVKLWPGRSADVAALIDGVLLIVE